MTPRVAIVGSRDYPGFEAVRAYVRELPAGTVVITGGARGVDRTAQETALGCGLVTVVVYPAWQRRDGSYDRGAGLARNRVIAELCSRMVAFWDGKSRGTEHAIACARELGRPVEIIAP